MYICVLCARVVRKFEQISVKTTEKDILHFVLHLCSLLHCNSAPQKIESQHADILPRGTSPNSGTSGSKGQGLGPIFLSNGDCPLCELIRKLAVSCCEWHATSTLSLTVLLNVLLCRVGTGYAQTKSRISLRRRTHTVCRCVPPTHFILSFVTKFLYVWIFLISYVYRSS